MFFELKFVLNVCINVIASLTAKVWCEPWQVILLNILLITFIYSDVILTYKIWIDGLIWIACESLPLIVIHSELFYQCNNLYYLFLLKSIKLCIPSCKYYVYIMHYMHSRKSDEYTGLLISYSFPVSDNYFLRTIYYRLVVRFKKKNIFNLF